MSKHIVEQNASVKGEVIISFVKVFTTVEFLSEADWEDTPIPVDAAGVMILDEVLVTSQLKLQPWQNADLFLGSLSSPDAFSRYESGGDGSVALKLRYASNKSAILGKWNELAAWVAEQQGTP